MPRQIDAVANQMKNTARNVVRSETVKVSRQTSIVRIANEKVAETLSGKVKKKSTRAKSGVYSGDDRVYIARDGYVRRSPVQKVRVPEGYSRKLMLRVIGGCLVGALIVAAVVLLLKYLF